MEKKSIQSLSEEELDERIIRDRHRLSQKLLKWLLQRDIAEGERSKFAGIYTLRVIVEVLAYQAGLHAELMTQSIQNSEEDVGRIVQESYRAGREEGRKALKIKKEGEGGGLRKT